MKYWELVIASLLRRKLRTALTVLSFAVALFLFCALGIVQLAFEPTHLSGNYQLLVLNRVSVILPLPVAYQARILRIPGVKNATYATWFGAVYQDARNRFVQFAVDVDTWRASVPEAIVADDQWAAFAADREGCIVGEQLAQRFGWKLGDRIPLTGSRYAGAWEFNIRGIYTGRAEDDLAQFWFHYDLLDERQQLKGLVGWYTVTVESPDVGGQVIKAIDTEFANSAWETKTTTVKEAVSAYGKSLGNIRALLRVVGAIVFVTLLLVSGNVIAIAVRERRREIAVLKAMGFGDRLLLTLVIVESMSIALLGGLVGLGLAKLLAMALAKLLAIYGDPTNSIIPYLYLPASTAALALASTLLVGLLAGVVPAVSAVRLRVAETLRRA